MPSKRVSLKGKGADLFFGDYEPPKPATSAMNERVKDAPDDADSESPLPSEPEAVVQPEVAVSSPDVKPPDRPARHRKDSSASQPASKKPPELASVLASNTKNHHSSKSLGNQTSERASVLASSTKETIAAIRRVVKTPGKEVSFVRLTPEEKALLADIVYTYKRQGQKTSENEINRIAINSLLLDYQENGEHSVLASVLAALLA